MPAEENAIPRDPQSSPRQFASVSDEELVAVERAGLEEPAQTEYDDELRIRGLLSVAEPSAPERRSVEAGTSFARLRNAALLASVACLIALPIPLWHAARLFSAARNWVIGVFAISLALEFVLPFFYFAVYRNKRELPITEELRRLAVTASILLGTVVAVALSMWIGSFTAGSVLVGRRTVWTLGDSSTLLGIVSNVATILFLIAIARYTGGSQLSGSVSNLLRVAVKVAAIAWGIWVVFSLVRVVMTPFVYFQLRDALLRAGRTPPALINVLLEPMAALLRAACLFAGPYIIWRATRRLPREQAS